MLAPDEAAAPRGAALTSLPDRRCCHPALALRLALRRTALVTRPGLVVYRELCASGDVLGGDHRNIGQLMLVGELTTVHGEDAQVGRARVAGGRWSARSPQKGTAVKRT
jgi:hypothetical protein